MNKIKQCAIYTRVSTDLQAEKEFSSCESQEEKVRSFIQSQNNWQIYKVYSDPGYTGAHINRPALQELLEDIKQRKIDIILVYKIDRLTRSPKDFYQLIEFFEKYNVSFISITERFDTSTPAGRLLRNIMLTFAQFERELASERTRDKMIERAKKGIWNGGIPPFGYKKENKRLIPHPKEAEIVRLIFETYIETGSATKVYDLLKEKDIKNRQGKPFYKSVIGFILRNIIYTGKIKYDGKIYQGIHQPIISEEIFEMAQKIHKKKVKKFRVYRDFLFGGLVNCENCNFKMSPCFTNKYSKGKLKRYYYYRCNSTHHKDWQSCSIKQVSADRLENYILENLERISLDKNYIENLVFRLNHSLNTPHRSGYELTKSYSKFSSEVISSLLKFFLSILAQKKGIERNLLVKKFIEKIIYSKENIKISLFYSENFKNFLAENSPASLTRGGASALRADKENIISSKNNQFVANNLAQELTPLKLSLSFYQI
jgi:DNA invertase Pin-like site-specific DNA recombinase